MQTAIVSAALAIVLFLCLYFAFRDGLRLGMNVSKGNDIKPFKTPIRAIKVTEIRGGY
jgi:hypothetical protein